MKFITYFNYKFYKIVHKNEDRSYGMLNAHHKHKHVNAYTILMGMRVLFVYAVFFFLLLFFFHSVVVIH